MTGVQNYAYSKSERSYLEDFEPVVAATIQHPYTAITSFNVGSAPHNLISGTAFAEKQQSVTTYKRSYTQPNYAESFNAKAVGLRSEQVQFIG